MPLYAWKCPDCLSVERHFRSIAQRNAPLFCHRGDVVTEMQRVLEAPAVAGDFQPYSCPVTGKTISGRREHLENLRKHGARVYEPGETEAARRAAAAAEADLDRRIGETVDEAIVRLPAPKREQLAVEMGQGLDISIERATGKA